MTDDNERTLVISTDQKDVTNSIDNKRSVFDFSIVSPLHRSIAYAKLERTVLWNTIYNVFERINSTFSYMTGSMAGQFTHISHNIGTRRFEDYVEFLDYLNNVIEQSDNYNSSMYKHGTTSSISLDPSGRLRFAKSLSYPILNQDTIAGNYDVDINWSRSYRFLRSFNGNLCRTVLSVSYFHSDCISVPYIPDTIELAGPLVINYEGREVVVQLNRAIYHRDNTNWLNSEYFSIEGDTLITGVPIAGTHEFRYGYFGKLSEAIYYAVKQMIPELDLYMMFIWVVDHMEVVFPARRNYFNRLYYWKWGTSTFNKAIGMDYNNGHNTLVSELVLDHSKLSSMTGTRTIKLITPIVGSDTTLTDAYEHLIRFYSTRYSYGGMWDTLTSDASLNSIVHVYIIPLDYDQSVDDLLSSINNIVGGSLIWTTDVTTNTTTIRMGYTALGEPTRVFNHACWPFLIDLNGDSLTPSIQSADRYTDLPFTNVSIRELCTYPDTHGYDARGMLSDHIVSPLDLSFYNEDWTRFWIDIDGTTSEVHISDGSYSLDELLAAIQAVLTTIDPSFSISFSTTSLKVTISCSVDFRIVRTANQVPGRLITMLGFPDSIWDQPNASSFTGTSIPRISNSTNHIYLVSSAVPNTTSNIVIPNESVTRVIAKIDINQDKGKLVVTDHSNRAVRVPFVVSPDQMINFKLLDESGRELQGSDSNGSITLTITLS